MNKFITIPNAIKNQSFFMLGDWVLIGEVSESYEEIININHNYDVEAAKLKHGISDDEWLSLINAHDNNETQLKAPGTSRFVFYVLKKMRVPSLDVPILLDIGSPELALNYIERKGESATDDRLKKMVLQSKNPKLITSYFTYVVKNPDEEIKSALLDLNNVESMVKYCQYDDNTEMRDKIIEFGNIEDIYVYLSVVGKNEKARKALINKLKETEYEGQNTYAHYLTFVDESDQEIFDLIVDNKLTHDAVFWLAYNYQDNKESKNSKIMFETLVNNTKDIVTDIDALDITSNENLKELHEKLVVRILNSGDAKRIVAAIQHPSVKVSNKQRKELRELIIKKKDAVAAYHYCCGVSNLASMRKVIMDSKDLKIVALYCSDFKATDEMLDTLIKSNDIDQLTSTLFNGKAYIPENYQDKIKGTCISLLKAGHCPEYVNLIISVIPDAKELVKEVILKSKDTTLAADYFLNYEQDLDVLQVVTQSDDVEAALRCAKAVSYDKDLYDMVATHGNYEQQSQLRTSMMLGIS